MEFIFPALYQTVSLPVPHGYVHYPYFSGIHHSVQEKINQHVYHTVVTLLQEQGFYVAPEKADVRAQYAVRTNTAGVLSFSLSNYTIMQYHANGIEYLLSMTYDSTTGKYYTLKDLFKPGSPYIQILSSIIKPQLEKRASGYIIKPFQQIRLDQEFYIADRTLVIVLPALEYTAHVVGILYFPISVYELSSIIDEAGPLGKIMRGI